MGYSKNSHLWPEAGEVFFREHVITPLCQSGPHCVATCLAMLTGACPEQFIDKVNTQDPVAWSEALQAYGMKLAYCPTDARKLKFYSEELLAIDDLFTISYYTTVDASRILRDPDENGWVCGSHIVILHRGMIYDPATGKVASLLEHQGQECHTKRIFRVVSRDSARGL